MIGQPEDLAIVRTQAEKADRVLSDRRAGRLAGALPGGPGPRLGGGKRQQWSS
jgi:hypothetical protein